MSSKLVFLALAKVAATALSAQFQSSTVPDVFWTIKNLARGSLPLSLPSPQLGITNQLRLHPTNTAHPSCSYELTISATNDQPDFDCRLTDYGSPMSVQNTTLTDPRYNTFGGYYCNGDSAHSGGWQISWGYNNETGRDSAVMTVLNLPLDEDAWFGWNYVNNRTQFEDVGPNPVYTIGTFS